MSNGPPSRPALRERYDRRRAAVITGAAEVFAERGYERTSVAELADRLGLATGAIYHYFAGKDELLVAICDQLMDPLLDQARSTVDQPGDRTGTEALGDLLQIWVAHVVAHRDHLLVFQQVRHLVDRGDGWRGVRRDRKEFEQLLARGIEAALPELTPERRTLARYALLGMVNHTVQWFRPRPRGALDPSEVAAGYLELTLGLGRGGQST